MALNNSSISFNGIDQYAKLGLGGSIRALGSFSFACFFKVGDKSVNTDQHAYLERQGAGSGLLTRFRFTPVAGKLQFGFSPKDGVADTSYTYNTKWDDRWHHAVFTARLGDRSTYEIILDAVSVASGTLVVPEGVTKISDTQPLGIYMGNHTRSPSSDNFQSRYAWHGLIDEVALNDQSIVQGTATSYITSLKRWDEQHDPALNETLDENLIVYYPFDENTGTTSVDRGSTVVDNTGTQQWYHGPQQTATFYKAGVTSNTLWAIDRPFIGNGLRDTTIPSTPTTPTVANITNDGFDLSWGASTDNVWVQFYDVHVSEFANFSSYSAFDTGRTTSKKIIGLLPATNYYVRVRAFDAELNPSFYTSTVSLTTLTTGDINPPNPPTNLSASFITHSSFRLSFTHSVSADAVGYKVDISPDANFRTFLEGFRNQDIGNSTYTDVFGVQALTSYYVRMRAYDAYDNESNDSVILRVNTPRQPDITPPLPIVAHAAKPVTATTATLNWSEGIDDTAVVGYYVDISTSTTFGDFVLTQTTYWSAIDVGNVLSYRVEGLEPATQYYYRVRGYDEAGNVSANSDESVPFVTDVHSLYEGGLMTSDEIHITWRENTTLEVPRPLVSDTTSLYTYFDLRDTVGTIQSTTLRFMPRAWGGYTTVFGGVGIRSAQGGINATPAGTEISVMVTQLDEYVEIDITPIVSTPAEYVIQIRSLGFEGKVGFSGYLDAGVEVANFNENNPMPPMLEVRTDPLSSSQPTEPIISVSSHYRQNLFVNPSFEVDTYGWIQDGNGSTITRVTGGMDGSYQLEVSGPGGTGFGQDTSYCIIGANKPLTVSFNMYFHEGAESYQMLLNAYNEAGTYIGRIAEVTQTGKVGSTRRMRVSGITPAGTAMARLRVLNATALQGTVRVDNFLAEATETFGAAFTGNTSGADWSSTTHRSTSRSASPTLSVISPYIGDSNANNSVTVAYKHSQDELWIPLDGTITTDRALKQHRFLVGPSIGEYNFIRNPSFEIADTYWSGGSRLQDAAHSGDYGYRIDASPFVARYTARIFVNVGQQYTIQARLRPDEEKNAYLQVVYYTAAAQFISSESSTYVYGTGSWELAHHTFTPPANTHFVTVRAIGDGPFVFDTVQVNRGGLLPYRDGTLLDGVWEGNPHLSMTGIQLQNETAYDILLTYTDPNGFFDADDSRTFVLTERYKTPIAPDDVFNAEPLALSATENTIFVKLPYVGDDNANATIRMEFKRSDLTVWNELRPIYDRNRKEITSVIPNVKQGTNYTVRAIIADPDGVNGAQNNIVSSTVTTNYLTTGIETDPHISFGGFVLMGREDGKIAVTQQNAFGFPDRRVDIEVLPRIHGGVEMQALWGTKTIRMTGFASGDSRADLAEVIRALRLGLSPNKQRLVVDTLSRHGRYYTATCQGLDINEDAAENIRHLEWQAEFVCADPFAYDISETTVPTFSASNNGAISVVNSGDAEVAPYFMITTPSSFPVNVSVINNSTGERIAPKSTIISGNRLIIDTERRSLLKNGVEIDYSGSFPHMAVGGNEFTFQLSISRTATLADTIVAALIPPTINVDMRWRHKYL